MSTASPPASPPLVLALAIAGISFAGPLTRLSDAHPLAIAMWRMVFALAVIVPLLVTSGTWRELRKISAVETLVALAAGVLLALHFWSWNASIHLTTIAASVFLVNLQPLFVAVLSVLLLRERPHTAQWLGIAVALCGALIIALPLSGAGDTGAPIGAVQTGNALAVLGAITAAAYYTAGRRLRQSLSLWPYVTLVYGACFVTLLATGLLASVPLGPYPPRDYFIFVALALGPMLLGHTGMNYSLRYLPAYVVNLAVLGEPVGATLIAALLPGIREVPSGATLLGGAFILAGMALSLRSQTRNTLTQADES